MLTEVWTTTLVQSPGRSPLPSYLFPRWVYLMSAVQVRAGQVLHAQQQHSAGWRTAGAEEGSSLWRKRSRLAALAESVPLPSLRLLLIWAHLGVPHLS